MGCLYSVEFDTDDHINLECVDVSHFTQLRVIGKGGFGKVQVCESRINGTYFAMKSISKALLLQHPHGTQAAWLERNIMSQVTSNFLVHLHHAFQDDRFLYLVMNFMPGGDLRYYMKKHVLTEDASRFYTAEIVLALQELHSLDVVYRDLKPDNVLLDEHGHIRLSDFGLSARLVDHVDGAVSNRCGTNGYMAPEMLTGEQYRFSPDLYALGVCLYELLHQKRPIPLIDPSHLEYRVDLSEACINLLLHLLQPDPAARIGCGQMGIEEVKSHPWFAGVDWNLCAQHQYQPPFVPDINVANCDPIYEIEDQLIGDDEMEYPAVTADQDEYFQGWEFNVRPHVNEHDVTLIDSFEYEGEVGDADVDVEVDLDNADDNDGGGRNNVDPELVPPPTFAQKRLRAFRAAQRPTKAHAQMLARTWQQPSVLAGAIAPNAPSTAAPIAGSTRSQRRKLRMQKNGSRQRGGAHTHAHASRHHRLANVDDSEEDETRDHDLAFDADAGVGAAARQEEHDEEDAVEQHEYHGGQVDDDEHFHVDLVAMRSSDAADGGHTSSTASYEQMDPEIVVDPAHYERQRRERALKKRAQTQLKHKHRQQQQLRDHVFRRENGMSAAAEGGEDEEEEDQRLRSNRDGDEEGDHNDDDYDLGDEADLYEEDDLDAYLHDGYDGDADGDAGAAPDGDGDDDDDDGQHFDDEAYADELARSYDHDDHDHDHRAVDNEEKEQRAFGEHDHIDVEHDENDEHRFVEYAYHATTDETRPVRSHRQSLSGASTGSSAAAMAEHAGSDFNSSALVSAPVPAGVEVELMNFAEDFAEEKNQDAGGSATAAAPPASSVSSLGVMFAQKQERRFHPLQYAGAAGSAAIGDLHDLPLGPPSSIAARKNFAVPVAVPAAQARK